MVTTNQLATEVLQALLQEAPAICKVGDLHWVNFMQVFPIG